MFNWLLNLFKKDKTKNLKIEGSVEPTDENFENPNVQMFEIKADGSISYFIGLDARPERQKQVYFDYTKKGRTIILKNKK